MGREYIGSTKYAGWCLAFIEDALGISNNIEIFGGDSAKESCEMYKDALRDGCVIHAWDKVRVDDYLEIEKLTALTGNHPSYLGWVPLERVLSQKP